MKNKIFTYTMIFFLSALLHSKDYPIGSTNKEAVDYYKKAVSEMQKGSHEGYKSANDLLTKAIQLDPYFVEAHAKLSICFLYQESSLFASFRNSIKAMQLAKQAQDLNPKHPAGYQAMAAIYQAVGELPKAQENINKAITFAPEDSENYFILGKILSQKEPEKAIAQYEKALSIDPDRKDIVPYYILAISKGFKTTAAIEKIEQLAKKFPSPEIYSVLGFSYGTQKEYQKGADAYKKSLELDKDNFQVRINLAIIYYFNLKEYNNALDQLKYLSKKESKLEPPEQVMVWGHTGIVYLYKEDEKKAKAELFKLLKYPEHNVDILKAVGFAYRDLKKADHALKFYDEAIALAPDQAILFALKGEVLSQEKKDYAKALASFKEAVELEPDSGEYFAEVAFAYYNLKNFDEALKAFRQAIELDPENAVNYYNMACVYSITGKKVDAIKFFKKSVELSPALIDHAKTDKDFDNIKESKDFKDILENKASSKPAKTPDIQDESIEEQE